MEVQNVITEYSATEDNDLKYMALKEEMSPLDVCDNLEKYVDQLLIPILMTETNAEIVNLVSLQIFPHAVELCLNNEKSGLWFDDIVVGPLIERMVGARATIAIQTLKAVSKKISEHRIHLGTRLQLIEEFLEKCGDTALSVEALYYLIQCYYDMHRGIPPFILEQILKLARSGSQDDITRLLICESISRATLDAILRVGTQLNIQELESASEYWWKLAPVALELLHSQILPALSNYENRVAALQILLNFQPFYTITSLDNKTLFGPENEALLTQSLKKLEHESSPAAPENSNQLHTQDADSDSDSDPEQSAYLAELPSDEEIEFENDLEGTIEPSKPQETTVRHISQEILQKLTTKDTSIPSEHLPPVISELFKKEDEDLSSLPQLQTAMQTLTQLASSRPTPDLPWSQITQELVLPRIVHDKTFVQKLKAGNLTQSIDEGATLRASAQSTLQQVLPLIDFRSICIMLEYEWKNGLQDKDPGVRQLAAELVSSLLDSHYSEIIGLQWQWYSSLLQEGDPRDFSSQELRGGIKEAYPTVG